VSDWAAVHAGVASIEAGLVSADYTVLVVDSFLVDLS
jgi:hypothetical protein